MNMASSHRASLAYWNQCASNVGSKALHNSPLSSSSFWLSLLAMILVFVIRAHATGAAPGYVQGNSATPQEPESTVAVTYTATQIAGDLNVVVVGWNDATAQVQSVVDTSGNTYTLAVGPIVHTGDWELSQAIYYAKNIGSATAGQNVVTVTFTTQAAYPDIRIAEYYGIDPVNPLDTAVGAQGISDLSDSGSLTSTNSRDLLVAANIVQTLTTGAGAGYTNRMITSPDGDILEDRSLASAGSYNATAQLYTSGAWIMQLVAFRIATNGPTFVQSASAVPIDDVETTTVTFDSAQTEGDLNVIAVGWSNYDTQQIQSISDTAGNTYVLAVGPTVQVGVAFQAIYYAKNIHGAVAGANQVTVTLTEPVHCLDIRIAEYSGLDKVNPIDAVGEAEDNGNLSSASVTTTTPNDLLVAANLVQSLTEDADPDYAMRELTTPDGDIFEDRLVQTTGTYSATATTSGGDWIMQVVAFKVGGNQPPVVNAGSDKAITLPINNVTLAGTVSDDGLPNNTLTITWTKLSGPGTVTFGTPNAASTSATFSTNGSYVLQLAADDSQLSGSDTVNVTVNAGPILTLSPSIAGPDVVSATQSLTANVKDFTGALMIGATVQFTVTGPNATTGSVNTDANGNATFTYTGVNSGSDTVQASSGGSLSNIASVSWIVPVQTISTTTILGQFFLSDGSGIFNTPPTATPVFSQNFPTLNFNPPGGTVPGNTSGVGINTRPWTDVTTDQNGNFTGTIVAQGNGF